MFGTKPDPNKLPCQSCERTRPPNSIPGLPDEVKTLGCHVCGYSLPGSADQRDPKHSAYKSGTEALLGATELVAEVQVLLEELLPFARVETMHARLRELLDKTRRWQRRTHGRVG